VALCLGLVGCHTFAKKGQGQADPAAHASSEVRPTLPDRAAAVAPAPPASPTEVSGLLAGQVVSSSTGPAPVTIIQVSEAAANPGSPPVQTESDGQGYFTIKGLQPGRHYQLTARTRGDRPLGGTAFATPPDARVVIQLTEGGAGASAPVSPAASAPPAAIGPQPAPPPIVPDQPGNRAERGWAPGQAPPPGARPAYDTPPSPSGLRGAAELGPPVGIQAAPANPPLPQPPPVSTPQPRTEVRPDSIAGGVAKGLDWAAPVEMPRQTGPNPLLGSPSAEVRPYHAQPAQPDAYRPQTRVPFCDLTGKVCYNFALNDVNGQPWEFRKRRGRLVLLDFWATWCPHCVQGIPNLNALQQVYGPYGLEVVGIAYEEGTFAQQVQKVNRIRQVKQVNYRMLLGPENCPVKQQFQVGQFPTTVLLDAQGRIIWRAEGLEQPQLQELEIIIRQQFRFR
jgi:thiol-disulfide isomerase/thioredoxin